MFCPFINCTTGPGSYSAFRVADALIPSDSQLCLPWSQGHVPRKCKMVERTVPGWKGRASLGSFSDCNLSLSHPAVAPCCSPGLTSKEPRYNEWHSVKTTKYVRCLLFLFLYSWNYFQSLHEIPTPSPGNVDFKEQCLHLHKRKQIII